MKLSRAIRRLMKGTDMKCNRLLQVANRVRDLKKYCKKNRYTKSSVKYVIDCFKKKNEPYGGCIQIEKSKSNVVDIETVKLVSSLRKTIDDTIRG